jgi:glycosyltransferase involved in cell wall biosynthesis
MKIAIITPEYPPYISGGIGSYNYELVKKLIEKGVKVIVIAPSQKEDEMRYYFGNHCKCYYLRTPSLKPKYFYFQIYNSERIRKIIEKEKPDIIQLNVKSDILIKALKDLLKDTGIKVVLIFHGSPSPYNRHLDSLKHFDMLDLTWTAAQLVYTKMEKALGEDTIDYVDAAIHVSKHVMYYNILCYENLRSLRNIVIYPGIDIHKYVKQIDTVRTETEHTFISSLGKRYRFLVFGARLMRYKGVIQLVKALIIARKRNPYLYLQIFGDGPLRSYVLKVMHRSDNSSGIFYYGKVPRELFLKKLAVGDILVHPSLSEAAPMVVIEAALLGKPVIAHKAPWSEEFVEGFNLGVTVDTMNLGKFAETLLDLANEENYEKFIERIQNQKIILITTFSSERMVKDYIEFYKKLV